MPVTDNPIELFKQERTAAFEAQDPMAALCSVATVDADGNPAVRTLVLRDHNGKLALFVNATSPKWPALQQQFAIMTYWPSQQIQYRINATSKPIDPQEVAASWQLRPDAPKKMDWFYEQVATQSTPIKDRETLLEQLETVELPEPLVSPENARGIEIVPVSMERLDLNQENGVHDRESWTVQGENSELQTLVP